MEFETVEQKPRPVNEANRLSQHETKDGDIHTQYIKFIVEGLKSSPRYLPSVLLWDSVGLGIYEQLMCAKDYYLTHIEKEVLQTHIDAIVESIGEGGVIIELGSGCLSKTRIILETFVRQQKHVTYYALDVCRSTLAQSLSDLRTHLKDSRYVVCRPLCMTYLDSVAWVTDNADILRGKRISVLWLGGSVGNESRDELERLLGGLHNAARRANMLMQFLVGVDGNKDSETVARAYDTRDGLSRRFILNVLTNLNRTFHTLIVNPNKWTFDGEWDEGKAIYRSSVKALEDQVINLGQHVLKIARGEKIHVIISRKISSEEFGHWLSGSGWIVVEAWKHHEMDYGFYRLSPDSSPAKGGS
ncbi:histidine-specific methyltransferase [Annulohypoxylon stygium]|nr:histidine-specific methyltransferase [Annulohypoxylon stygium]